MYSEVQIVFYTEHISW